MDSGLSIFIQNHYEGDGLCLSFPGNVAADELSLFQDAPMPCYGCCFSIAEAGDCAWRIVDNLWDGFQDLWLTVKAAWGRVKGYVARVVLSFVQRVTLAGRALLARVHILRI